MQPGPGRGLALRIQRLNRPAHHFWGPLLVFLLGAGLALLLVPGPWPPLVTGASYGCGLLIYRLCAIVAARGRAGALIVLLVLCSLLCGVLAFGPRVVDNRKVTGFNRWAYALGADLPRLLEPGLHPNGVAALLVITLALVLGMSCATRGLRRWLCWAAALALGLLLVLSVSRAGWVAGVTALLLLAGSHGRRQQLLLGLGLVLALLLALAGRPARGQPALLSTESLSLRLTQWSVSLQLLREHPLTGLGPGRFAALYAGSVAGTGLKVHKTPNNMLLEIWADAGLPGLLALAWIVRRTLQLRQAQLLAAGLPQVWLLRGAYAAGSALLVHGLWEANTVMMVSSAGQPVQLASPLPYVVLGLLAGLVRQLETVNPSPAGTRPASGHSSPA